MKAYSAWYDRQTKQLVHLEKDTYDSVDHIRSCGALMAGEYEDGATGNDGIDVWVAWDVRGTHEYLGVFSLSGDPVDKEDLDRIEAQAKKYKKRWS